jgi:hypothetical protein
MTPHYLWNWNNASERPDKLTMLGKGVEIALPCKIEVTDAGLRVKPNSLSTAPYEA